MFRSEVTDDTKKHMDHKSSIGGTKQRENSGGFGEEAVRQMPIN